jgi:hypothetical protein
MEKEEVMIFRKALEAQKFALYSFTSCGWFFTDISGIETVQNLAYACRALQLGIPDYKNTGSLEMFLNDLEGAVSNLPNTNGRTLVERYILSNFDHEQILAFTAATLKSLGIFKSLVFNLFSYNFKLQQTLAIDEKGVRYIGFSVEIENEFTGEFSDWSVLIAHRENEDLTGWVISGAALSHSKGSGGHPELWMGEPGARTFTLMDVFQTSQHQLTGHFLQKISKDTNARFGTWMKKHERELDILSRLNLPLPEYCRAPLSFVFQEQWDSAIKKIEKSGTEDDVFTDLLELTRTMNRFTIKVELEYGAKLLEKYLVLELSKLAENLNGEICDRTRYLLNIVDRFSIPVSKHKLEDMFHPLLNSKVHELYAGLSCDTHSARTEKRELLLKMLNFARRMNFNTDAFQVR